MVGMNDMFLYIVSSLRRRNLLLPSPPPLMFLNSDIMYSKLCRFLMVFPVFFNAPHIELVFYESLKLHKLPKMVGFNLFIGAKVHKH
jgi:hypothetical protein